MKILRKLIEKRKNRKPYNNLEEVPTPLLMCVWILSLICFLHFGYPIKKALPIVLEGLNKTPSGEPYWAYWFLFSIIGLNGLLVWGSGCISCRCSKIFAKRWGLSD